MYLKYLQIVNYKNLKSTKFEFKKGANTIIGENDSGKSNAITALRILLDDSYYYSAKRLKESDFADFLDDWKGHWIIISAYFDEITCDEKNNEICKDMIPDIENEDFLKSFIRCEDHDFGTVTLFIRPHKNIRKKLANADKIEEFDEIRSKIKLTDYEFSYTSRSQVDFTNNEEYKKIVGKLDEHYCVNPEEDDASVIGSKVDILEIWKYISVEFIDALRDVSSDLKKPKNPIRRIVDTIKSDISVDDSEEIKTKINEVNKKISNVEQISSIGSQINGKLNEMIGMVYSPDVTLQSQMKDDITSLSKYLTMAPSDKQDIDLLGLGHLNMLYIALKLVEFEVNRNYELMNIMIIEEPEAHIHPHIQKTLFRNLKVSKDYTQVVMTTHSTHLSEVAEIEKVNILRTSDSFSEVMQPANGLNEFGERELELKEVTLTQCLERYLDAKRSVLLFSKGIMLVEGDGEEILIPSLVKEVMGISLDELGIGLINIGSVAFENVACIFHENRLKRHCAIITDLDQVLDGAKKCSIEAAKRGISRQKKLDRLFGANEFVDMFYAPYTLEIDFANEKINRKYIEKLIDYHYIDEGTIIKHKANLEASPSSRYDSVMTLAKGMRKGWYATVLASNIMQNVKIPEYILEAIAFASRDSVTYEIIIRMMSYSLNKYSKNQIIEELGESFQNVKTEEERMKYIKNFCEKMPQDDVTIYTKKVRSYAE
jgi:predicted ATP-dependent endonuclease of OLD family